MLTALHKVPPQITMLVVFALALGGTTSAQKSPPKPDDDIYEAVVRYQIQNWDMNAESYCLEINRKNPSEAFLNRFRPLPVKAASGCRKRTKFTLTEVVDKKNGKRSVIFDLGRIEWLTPNEVKVDGGYYCADLCMASGTYRVALQEGRWVVKEFTVHVIS